MSIQKLRDVIDEIDDEIMDLLVQRKAVVKEIYEVKESKGLDKTDNFREEEIFKRAQEKGINKKIFQAIIDSNK